jgi:hypothetical protein
MIKHIRYFVMARKLGIKDPSDIEYFCRKMQEGKETASEIVRYIFTKKHAV